MFVLAAIIWTQFCLCWHLRKGGFQDTHRDSPSTKYVPVTLNETTIEGQQLSSLSNKRKNWVCPREQTWSAYPPDLEPCRDMLVLPHLGCLMTKLKMGIMSDLCSTGQQCIVMTWWESFLGNNRLGLKVVWRVNLCNATKIVLTTCNFLNVSMTYGFMSIGHVT